MARMLVNVTHKAGGHYSFDLPIVMQHTHLFV